MATLIGMPRAAWRRQPLSAVDLSDRYSNADHVFLATQKNYGFGKTDFTVNGNILYAGTPAGVGAYSPANNGANYFSLPEINFSALNWSGFTILFAAKSPPVTNYHPLSACVTYPSYSTGGWLLHFYSTSELVFLTGTSSTALTAATTNGDELIGCAVWTPSSRVITLSRNNKPITYSDSTATTASSGNMTRYVAGYRRDASSWRTCNSPVYMVAVLPYAVDSGQRQDLVYNPWQLFKPRIARFISIPSGGVAIPNLSLASFANRVPSVTLTY
jgi:hypothetical protein